MRLIILLLFTNSLFGQIQNPDFEVWDLFNGREKPAEWKCPNLCPSPSCGPCDKIDQGFNDFAVRIHNVMPCVSSDNQAKSRSPGFIEHYFIPTNERFKISYDLKIDSIESPAEFIFTLRGKLSTGRSDSILVWKTNSIQSSRIESEIDLANNYDSLFIQFKVKGALLQNALHDCDFGYLSATVDDIRTSEIVGVNDIEEKSLSIYPNPFDNKIQIDASVNVELWQLFNLTGKLMSEGVNNTINELEDFENGVYLLFVKSDKNTYWQKVIK